MTAVAAWLRIDLRARAKSLVVLTILVAVTSGVVLTAVAGSRRGATTVDRLLERTLPATVAALPNQPGFDWGPVAGLPNVEAIGRFPVSGYQIDDLGYDEGSSFAFGDATMQDIERPVVLEGRLADPTRDDEAVITQAFEGTYGKGVGDTVRVQLFTPEQTDALQSSGEVPGPSGPVIESRIVGVVRSPWFSDSGDAPGGTFIPSTGLFTQHPENLVGAEETVSVNALVRLRGGAADVPRFREDLADLTGRRDIEFFDLAAMASHATDVAEFEANALLAFAVAALVAAVFLVGQSVVRYVAASTQDLQVLTAVGLRPREVRVAAAAGPTLAAVIGTGIAVGAAYLASSRFPTGTSAPLEPSPGRHADLTVLGLGFLVLPLLVVGGAVLASWAATRGAGVATARRSSAASLAARAGAPIPLTIGTGFALDRGRGSQSVPVYPALIGAVVGVLGVVAALTFADGVNDASANPARFGQMSELNMFIGFNGEDFVDGAPLMEQLARDPDILAVNDTRQGVLESGRVDVPAFALDPVSAPPPIVLLEGRLPTGEREATIAPASASSIGAGVGDLIELSGSRATGSYLVTGIAFVPEGVHNSYDEGAWLLRDDYDTLIEGFKFHTAEVTVRPGADVDEVAARASVALGALMGLPPEATGEILSVRTPPARLGELRQVRQLPLLLAGFLALLAVAAVGHALATAVRRRRHDLAVLRAVGVTRWQSRAMVLVQAVVLAAVGLSIGAPTGFALGRTLWRSVAADTPLDYVPPVALWALVLVAPIALLTAVLLAAWPSHRAASLRVAHVLRTE